MTYQIFHDKVEGFNQSLLVSCTLVVLNLVSDDFKKVVGVYVGIHADCVIAWGQKLMQAARGTDRNCTCKFDMAAQVPPEKMHWARYHDHHMAPVELDNNGINQLNLLTLVANTRRECIQFKLGETSRIEHWPHYAMAQLEFYGFKIPPIYGSLNIIPRGKEYFHRTTSNRVGALDDFEVDDHESINYDEDYDGTHGESK
jgi:hypothetical protein